MEALRQMIQEKGKGIGTDIVKVDMFPNHRIDTALLFQMGEAWAEEFRGAKPDLVLAGINYGYNVGSDIQYSATAGGAFEAAFQGITGIAFSEDASFCHETTDVFLHKVLEELADKKLDEAHIWNVNFPGCAADECRGILYNRTVSRREIYDDSYQVVGELPGGGTRYMVNGRYQEEAEPETDFRAVLDHYVSIGTVTNVG